MPTYDIELTKVYEHVWFKKIEAPDLETAKEMAKELVLDGKPNDIHLSSLEVDRESQFIIRLAKKAKTT